MPSFSQSFFSRLRETSILRTRSREDSNMHFVPVTLVACTFMCAALGQPVDQAPVLKEAPQTVYLRVEKPAKPFDLNCELESGDSSKVKFEWYKDDTPLATSPNIKQNQGKLTFSEPNDDDEGVYQCFATTAVGVASTRQITVEKSSIKLPQKTTKTVNPVEGRPFELDCKLPEGSPTPKIEWKKKKADGKTESFLSPRIFSPQGSLYFSNATEEDITKGYTLVCLVSSPAVDGEVLLAEYTIESLQKDDKPADNEVVKQYVSPDMTAVVGEVTMIYCVYGGTPMPHPDWWKDGKNVNGNPEDRVTRYNRSKGKRLLIKKTLPEDEGTYTCIIDNEVGKVQEYSMHLKIVPGIPTFTKKPEKRVSVKQGDDIFLPCEVEQMLPFKSDLKWTYNAEPLKNTRATFNDKGLSIKKAQKEDSGYYGCVSTNDAGEGYAETLVQVS